MTNNVHADGPRFSLNCPLGGCPIAVPTISQNCEAHHLQTFDLNSFVLANHAMGDFAARWKCPVCQRRARPFDLRFCTWTAQALLQAKRRFGDDLTHEGTIFVPDRILVTPAGSIRWNCVQRRLQVLNLAGLPVLEIQRERAEPLLASVVREKLWQATGREPWAWALVAWAADAAGDCVLEDTDFVPADHSQLQALLKARADEGRAFLQDVGTLIGRQAVHAATWRGGPGIPPLEPDVEERLRGLRNDLGEDFGLADPTFVKQLTTLCSEMQIAEGALPLLLCTPTLRRDAPFVLALLGLSTSVCLHVHPRLLQNREFLAAAMQFAPWFFAPHERRCRAADELAEGA